MRSFEQDDIDKLLRTIRGRKRALAVVTKAGRIRAHEHGSAQYWRSIEAGWQWVGTYGDGATAEMIGEDLEAV